jgi:hypothetical protein
MYKTYCSLYIKGRLDASFPFGLLSFFSLKHVVYLALVLSLVVGVAVGMGCTRRSRRRVRVWHAPTALSLCSS